MKKKLTVIIPVYNEELQYINAVTDALKEHGFNYIVVDDGSMFPVVGDHVIRREKNRGCGSAVKLGVRSARTSYVATIDADSQYDVVDLVHMWEGIEDEDLLIGRRICHQGSPKRLWGRMFLKVCASIGAGKYLPDINSGVRIFKRSLMKSYSSIICDEFSWVTSQLLCFSIDKYKVKWVDIGFYPLQGSKSTMDEIRHGCVALFHIIKITVGLRTRNLRRYFRERKKRSMA